MLFERTDLTAGGTRRRGVSTSYGNRRPKQFATLTNVPTIAGPKMAPLSFAVTSNNNFHVASGNTVFLSSPVSDEGISSELNLNTGNRSAPGQNNKLTVQHTNPVVGQTKLLASHKNSMKNNVAKFVKDHNLGARHFQQN